MVTVIDTHWQLVAVVGMAMGLLALHVLVVRFAADRGIEPADGSPDTATAQGDGDGSVDRKDGSVTCPECGAGNEAGYRYCRDCVSELPVAMDFGRGSNDPLDSFMR